MANLLLKVMYYLEDRAEDVKRTWYSYLCRRFGHLSPEEKFSALICSRCKVVLVNRQAWKIPVRMKEE